ncbi:MAG: modulated sigma54 specific transcriptional regulator, Fis family [Pelosinus sp.]|jgi:PAS domain S-box-containing protein|nr:modulated sigma54 specific transcriptional regulator, Fis family [Pelosinus sp.]
MRVRDLMNINIVTVLPTMMLKEAAVILNNAGAEKALVVDDDGKLIGLINQEGFIKALATGDIKDYCVQDIMTKDVISFPYAKSVSELQEEFILNQSPFLPIVDGENRPMGILQQTDVATYLSDCSLSLLEGTQAIINAFYNGVIAVNAEGIVILFNAAAEYITGLTAEAVIGHHVDNVLPNTRLSRVLETGVTEVNQQQTIGNCTIITNRSPILNGNKIIGSVAVFQDITELQTIAVELENVKNLKSTLESAIESFFEGIVIVDKSGKITMINQSYCDFLGVEGAAVIGKHVVDVIPNTRMHVVAQGGKAEITEIQRINEHNCVVTRIPIVKDGETVGAVGKVVFKDVKDLKILSNKLTKLEFELEYYKEELRKVYGGKYTFESIIGNSEKMEWIKSIAFKASKGNSTVLILGESGTGKEVFAQAIHNGSIRNKGPFIKVNCAALPENLLETELFGYDEGAFTGAKKGGKPGKFELSNRGTIFLDEIGDMPISMQVKLLRVLQEREFERVGGTKTIKLDLRVIAATNRDLTKMIEQGQFRQDLYYRLDIISLAIPPLRERTEDIPLLCDMLLKKINKRVQHYVEGIAPATLKLLMAYKWPGNVRELENVLERALNLMDDNEVLIAPEHLPPVVKKMNKVKEPIEVSENLAEMLDDTEKQAILKVLEEAGGNKSKAAKLLGIHRSGFYQKLQKHNIK